MARKLKVAIIGSRHITDSEGCMVFDLARRLTSMGISVETGGAFGTDQKAASGATQGATTHKGIYDRWMPCLRDHLRIHLPWNRFNQLVSMDGNHIVDCSEHPIDIRQKAVGYARSHNRLKYWSVDQLISGDTRDDNDNIVEVSAIRDLMSRNSHIVLGDDLESPVDLVFCCAFGTRYDSRGRICDVKGGTGHGVRLANSKGIPVVNLRVPEHKIATQMAMKLNITVGQYLLDDIMTSLDLHNKETSYVW